jgi:two-component system response regulator RegX3
VQELWRSDFVGDERICDTHIVGLRRKVESDPARPARILSVRGVGYKLAER